MVLIGDKLTDGQRQLEARRSLVCSSLTEQRETGNVAQLVVSHPLSFLLAQTLSYWEQGWKDGLGVKSTCCFLKGPKGSVPGTYMWFPILYNFSSRGPNTSSEPYRPGAHLVHRHTHKQNTHTHKLKIKLNF